MAALGNAQADVLLEFVFNRTVPAAPANVYLGLSTADPTADGSGLAEPSGGSYARVQVNANWGTAVDGVIANDVAITFPEATAAWGTITHWILTNHLTNVGDAILWRGAFNVSKYVSIGDECVIDVGEITTRLE